ncbi:MAG: tail fiber domain-containing protein, partial [Sphingomonadaceae bacterium]|nr:tail fiber domain-containing protein [Sphingomonadaceae bacterium]
MGGKSSQSTQQIQIPPEVLARYNAVNARAEMVAERPFQQYSTDPNAFVAPLTPTQQAGIANTNYYAGTAQPYYASATRQLLGAQDTAMPFYGQAAQQVGQAQNVGNRLAGLSMESLYGAQGAAAPLQGQAATGFMSALNQAQPFNVAAAGQYAQGLQQGRGLAGLAAAGTQQALLGGQPFQQTAAQFMGAGAQAVNPGALGAQQINQYMSPYLANVLQGTAALQNQMNQQAQSAQLGNAIRQGAFGGDRAGIAAANLAQQQQLANSKIFADILNQSYGQALSAAQQQQQLGLGAEQANRAALQNAAQQSLAIGQQGFGQGLSAAQQQAALGQQLFGMGSSGGQNLAALGQQIFGQGTGTAQQQAALAQQLFNQGLGTSQQFANLGQQQFGQGMTAAQQNAALGAGLFGMGSQTAQGLANLGLGAQSAGLQGAQAQMAAGQAQQQTQQAGLQALYNQFLQQQSYPFQVAQFLANIAMGTGALSGSTTQTNQAMGGFSDKRLKENVKPVGKTFDGQTIYSYNFKGDPQTEIGLIAQEVEKRHPEAVGLAGGYKTVRYDKATEDAADRGHFAAGGSAMGGGVMPMNAGEGYFDGGAVGYDPGIMQQILASYERMYAPLQGAKGGLGAASFVPEAGLPVGQLMTAGDLP